MIIYKITNVISGKIYIGQTVQKMEKRFKHHCLCKPRYSYIDKAIKKYGKENFKVEEIDGANSLSELNYLEQHYIWIYNSLSPNGYNLTVGGRNALHTEEQKRKITESLKKIKRPVFTKEWRENISKSKKGKAIFPKGTKFSKEHKDNMSKVRKGFTSDARRAAQLKSVEKFKIKVRATKIETQESYIFDSLKECADFVKMHSGTISRILRNIPNYSSKIWKFEYIE